MFNPYTIKLENGKYTIVLEDGQALRFLRHDEDWPGAEPLRYAKVVGAMADRIKELEIAIGVVLRGSIIFGECRNDDGMCSFDEDSTVPFKDWERRLRRVLEQE